MQTHIFKKFYAICKFVIFVTKLMTLSVLFTASIFRNICAVLFLCCYCVFLVGWIRHIIYCDVCMMVRRRQIESSLYFSNTPPTFMNVYIYYRTCVPSLERCFNTIIHSFNTTSLENHTQAECAPSREYYYHVVIMQITNKKNPHNKKKKSPTQTDRGNLCA